MNQSRERARPLRESNLRKRPTIFDLERLTGFSRGTISRAFNGSPEISAVTRDMILKRAGELGYTPHPGARTMKLGRTERLGLLIPHLQSPYYADLVECLDLEARHRKKALMLGLSHYDAGLEADLVRHWAAGETDGIIIDQADPLVNNELFDQLRLRGVPLIFLHSRPSDLFDQVTNESAECFERATRHLLALGHRRIGYFGQQCSTSRSTAAFITYERVMKEEGLYDELLIVFGSYQRDATAVAWAQWVALESPPTAILCFNDMYACGVVEAARMSGLEIPRDLSVIGRDDIPESARLGLTTIRNDRAATAREAFSLLDRRLENLDAPSETRCTLSDLIMRNTVAAPRQHELKIRQAKG